MSKQLNERNKPGISYTGRIIVLLMLIISIVSCKQPSETDRDQSKEKESAYLAVAPEWSKNANIYEVNIRQYTPEGTIKAFENHLPRLKNMGVDILWLMPVHPVGEKNRKGTLGSYYSVKDYKAINPEFGTMDDFKSFVNVAHEMGFKVILDWVANHTAWDHQWIYDRPEWYTRDSTGNIVYPADWVDVADLNYDQDPLWDAMIDALKFWVAEADVDGYRCDVASMVPTPFWERARYELDQIKPVFMLAEAEKPELHDNSFDMTYAWELHHIFNEIAKGNKSASDLDVYFAKNDSLYPSKAYRMAFITNHDENSWNGTVEERLGSAADVMAVLSYTLPGMPLIYSGQEIGLNKRLEFFEKDQIEWDYNSPKIEFYTTLNKLKNENKALWNGIHGGEMKRINIPGNENLYIFTREKDNNILLVLTNLNDQRVSFKLRDESAEGKYTDIISGKTIALSDSAVFEIGPWGYQILVKE